MTDTEKPTRLNTRRGLRRATLGATLCLAAALLVSPVPAQAGEFDNLLAPEQTCPGQTNPSLKRSKQAQALLCMHRYARGVLGLPALYSVKKLRKSSRLKAKDLRRCQQLSHTACGRSPFYWLRRVGFKRSKRGGENLALGSGSAGTARGAMQGWLNSPSHREVILQGKFKRIGISMVRGKYRGYRGVQFWVAHVASKR